MVLKVLWNKTIFIKLTNSSKHPCKNRYRGAFNAPNTDFHNVSGAATKWRDTTRNTSFRQKVCGAKPNGHCRAPKWCENTQNMSFGSKGVH